MTLEPAEFIRGFLLHVRPAGLHRIQHDGLLANGCRRVSLALVRELLPMTAEPTAQDSQGAVATEPSATFICRPCGQPMGIVQLFMRGLAIRVLPP
jgi:hypothetical protein